MSLFIQLPDDLIRAIRLPENEVQARLKRELAVTLYAKDLLSFGKARQLAEMTRWDFHDLLGEEGVARRYDVEELDQDLETLENLD